MGLFNFDELTKKAQNLAGDLGEKARNVADVASVKAREAADSAKVSMALAQEQRELEKNYRAIGQWFCTEFAGEIPEALRDVMAAVKANQEKIAQLQAARENGGSYEAVELNSDPPAAEPALEPVACPVCGEMGTGKFCGKCGAPLR